MARLCPLFSGSSGNSFYIGARDAGVLIDTGRSAKQLQNMLSACGVEPRAIQAIFVTHEHSDHVCGLSVFASRHKIPVYASRGTLETLNDMGVLNGKFPCEALGAAGVVCGGMRVRPFRVPHDCAEGFGYRVETADGRTVVFSTDLGYVPDSVRESLRGCDVAVLESNHDVGMLRHGPYPYPLKQRILSRLGHLSNDACAAELPRLAQEGTTRFVLAHLSRENNTPQAAHALALSALCGAGLREGLDFELRVAPRENTAAEVMIF